MNRNVTATIGLAVLLLAGLWWWLGEDTPPPADVTSKPVVTPAPATGPPPSGASVGTPGEPRDPPTVPSAPVAPAKEPAAMAAETREITVAGETHRFVERRYQTPYVLPRLQAPGPRDTVEASMASYISAMQAVDWDWWLTMWDAPGRALVLQRVAESSNREGHPSTRERLVRGWRAHYSGTSMEIVRRVELPGYVLVYMRRVGEPDDSPDLRMPLAMKRQGDRWVFTHDLREHPVYNLEMALPGGAP